MRPAQPLSAPEAAFLGLEPRDGIAVASYAGTITFGIQTDRDVIPDPAQLRDDLAAAFERLRTAATGHSALAADGAPRISPLQPRAS